MNYCGVIQSSIYLINQSVNHILFVKTMMSFTAISLNHYSMRAWEKINQEDIFYSFNIVQCLHTQQTNPSIVHLFNDSIQESSVNTVYLHINQINIRKELKVLTLNNPKTFNNHTKRENRTELSKIHK